jgi:PIN domain nuclease of toxin-antitoxin system
MVVALLDGSLKPSEQNLVIADTLAISDIVFWELAKLVELRRLELDLDSKEFQIFARAVTVFPITVQIARKSTELDFHSDPADEIIAATSVIEDLPLLTRDKRIIKSKLVPLAR